MQRYLLKHSLYNNLISENPADSLGMIVVIPSYNEDRLFDILEDLRFCIMPACDVEIIVVLNHTKGDSEVIQELHMLQRMKIQDWNAGLGHLKMKCFPITIEMPGKHGGVGLARKIGMDEAVRRFARLGLTDGIILSLDADCRCASEYLIKVFDYFLREDAKQALSIGFSHQFTDLSMLEKEAIIKYELHLRYFINAQQEFKYPFSIQTIGSCFAVTAKGYQYQGGMNKRQAGEDFYFLHKFSVIMQLDQLRDVLVYPSGRVSTRVPFGTGRAVINILANEGQLFSYNLDAIHDFCRCVSNLKILYDADENTVSDFLASISLTFQDYMLNSGFQGWVQKAKENTSTKNQFSHRLLRYCHPFRLMKWLHFARDHGYPSDQIEKLAFWLLHRKGLIDLQQELEPELLLDLYRKLDGSANQSN